MVSRLSASQDENNTGWRFYFKLYCFVDTDNVPKDSVEFAFMFEQVHRRYIADTTQQCRPQQINDKSVQIIDKTVQSLIETDATQQASKTVLATIWSTIARI